MRTGFVMVAVVALLVETAFADPFTGRYVFESEQDQGAGVSGFIDFVNAPMGTTTFRLGDAFVSGFSIVVSGPGYPTLTYDDLGDSIGDDSIVFDAALGAATLNPTLSPVARNWVALGDLDGLANGDDFVFLGSGDPMEFTAWQGFSPPSSIRFRNSFDSAAPAWNLALVPEPGTLVLSSVAVGSALVWRRRRRRA